jgi:acyl CoA:acetate/3-ketoacid CoA transferase
MSGLDFGTATNYQAVIDHACAFDFIDGGGSMRPFSVSGSATHWVM